MHIAQYTSLNIFKQLILNSIIILKVLRLNFIILHGLTKVQQVPSLFIPREIGWIKEIIDITF